MHLDTKLTTDNWAAIQIKKDLGELRSLYNELQYVRDKPWKYQNLYILSHIISDLISERESQYEIVE